MLDKLEQDELFPAPQRRGTGSEEFFAICAVDGHFSATCAMSHYRRPRYVRAYAKKKSGKRVLRTVQFEGEPKVQAKVRIRSVTEDKKPICRYHRRRNELTVQPLKTVPVGPTTIQAKLVCPEQFLWFTDRKLSPHLRTTEAMVIGSVAHKIAARYAVSGKVVEEGEHGVIALVNLAVTNPEQLGLSHPLKDVLPGTMIKIRERAVAMIRNGIKAGLVRSLAEIQEDPTVVYAEAEHPIKAELSMLRKELLKDSTLNGVETTLRGQIDLLVVRLLPNRGLEITISDYKTSENLPTESELGRFETSLQMQLYAAWGLWAALTRHSDMPKHVQIRLEHIFLTDLSAEAREVQVNRQTLRNALVLVAAHTRGEEQAKAYERTYGWQKMALNLYQPKTGTYCFTCPAYQLCTATRDQPVRSDIDQILPARKVVKHRENRAHWDL